ncbi:MAG: ABC transporter ATP-binding protein, partial [Opitutae bacterium]|nr:ABC transporter ATP-binding protein [Opitutae bacterium]
MEARKHNEGEANSLLEVSDLSIGINRSDGVLPLTDRVSFHLNQGEVLGLIGESGCGKSITSLAIMGMLPEPGGTLLNGKVQFMGQDIFSLSEAGLNQLRGQKISMIFQEPFAAMNPLIRIGDQMLEVFEYHPVDFDKYQKIKDLLDEVGLTDHNRILQSYPHELSGGMLQRIMIAMSLLLDPDLLIADEPTTALDVTVQAQIMNLIVRLKKERKMSVLLISHNISLMAQYTDRIAVMYAGQIVESNHTESFLEQPNHPYSNGLMHAIPTLDKQERKIISIPGQVPEPGKYKQGCRFKS